MGGALGLPATVGWVGGGGGGGVDGDVDDGGGIVRSAHAPPRLLRWWLLLQRLPLTRWTPAPLLLLDHHGQRSLGLRQQLLQRIQMSQAVLGCHCGALASLMVCRRRPPPRRRWRRRRCCWRSGRRNGQLAQSRRRSGEQALQLH